MCGVVSSLSGAQLDQHLHQVKEYGRAGHRELESGRIRYYGEISPARVEGEMAGRRMVREWDPESGAKRMWHETVDHGGNIRQVRPQLGSVKVHYTFDASGNYTGSWSR